MHYFLTRWVLAAPPVVAFPFRPTQIVFARLNNCTYVTRLLTGKVLDSAALCQLLAGNQSPTSLIQSKSNLTTDCKREQRHDDTGSQQGHGYDSGCEIIPSVKDHAPIRHE